MEGDSEDERRHQGSNDGDDSFLGKDRGGNNLGTFEAGALVAEQRKNFFSEVDKILDEVLAGYVEPVILDAD